MADNFAYDVFLSHSSKDKEIVRAIAERLRMDGLRVWFADWDIRAGDSIPAKIDEGLEQCRVLVLCMSANAFGSEWAQLESYAFRFRDPLNKGRRVIPLRLDDAPIKGSLAQFHYINWNLTDREPEYARLVAECRAESNLSSTDEPSALGQPHVNHAPRSYPRHRPPRTREETVARARYLNYLDTDISNRLAASIHNARLLDINVENRTGSTLPWGYRAYAPSSKEMSFERFADAFECFNRRLLLLGTPGCGKTTTLLHLVTTLIEEARKDETAPVPLFFNLSSFRPPLLTNSPNLLSQRVFGLQLTRADTAFEDWLVNQITALRGAAVSTHVARSWVESGAVALLLDGLDEVAEQYVREVAASLNRSYFQRHPDMPVVVACRSVEYQPLEDSDNTRLWLEGAVVLQPLSDAQVLEYLEKTEARGLKDAVPGDEVLMEMARTPLTLSMMVLAYGSLSPKKMQQDMPLLERRRHLLDTYVSRMMQRHARRNAGIPYDENEKQDQPTVYARSLIDRSLGWMAVRLSERSQTLFPAQDLHDFLIQNPKVVKPQFWSTSTVTAGLIGMLLSVLFAVTISKYSGSSYQFRSLVALAVGACLVGTLVVWQFAFHNQDPNEENSYRGIRRRRPKKPWWNYVGIVLSGFAVAVYLFWTCGVILVSFSQLVGGMSPIKLGLSLIAAPAVVIASYLVSTSWWRRLLCFVFAVIVGGAGAWVSLRFSVAPNLSTAVAYGLVIAALVSVPLAIKSEDAPFIFGLTVPPFVGVLLMGAFALAVWITGNLDAVDAILIVSPLLGGIMLATDKEARAAGFTLAAGAVIGISLIGFDNFICLVCFTFLLFVFAQFKFSTLGTSILSLNAIGRWLEARCANALNHGLLCGYGRVPVRFRRFLVYCKEVMLLKTAPNGYEFMHRLLRDHFAIRELIPRLSVSSGPAKLRVIQQLSLQGESSLDALHDLASHNDPQIRAAAALGLGRVPSAQVPSLLKDILHRDSDSLVRAAAVEASRPLAEETARPLLEEASVDADGAVRAATIRAVGRRHPAEFLEILRAGIFDNDEQVVREVLLLISDSSTLDTQITKLIHIAEPTPDLSMVVGPESLERLHPFLWDPDLRVRETCAEILGLIGRPESVAPLQRAVTDSEASVRSKVVYALGKCGDASVRGHLITALRDPSNDVRQAAANGLHILRFRTFKVSTPEDVISALCEALTEQALPVGKLIAGMAVVVIGLVAILRLGSTANRSVGLLVGLAVIALGTFWMTYEFFSPTRSRFFRECAAQALQNLEAQPKLVEALIRAGRNGNSAAKETLCSLRGLEDSLFVSYLPSVIDGLIGASQKSGARLADPLSIDGDSFEETDFTDASGEQVGDPLKQLNREGVVPELLRWLRMSGKLKMKAVRALGFLKVRAAVPDLSQMLERGQRQGSKAIYWLIGAGSTGLPFAAAQALGQIGDESSVPFLESVARDQSRTTALRTTCINALGQFRVTIAVEALARILEDVRSSEALAKECASSLGRTKCIAAVEVLDNVMQSHSQMLDLRPDVVMALGEIGGEQALALVCTTFKDPSLELIVRNACVRALARIGGPSAEGVLIDTLRDSDEAMTIRIACVEALGQSGNSAAIEMLVDLIDEGSTNEDLWQACIAALAEGGKSEAIGILCETIQTRPDNLKLRWACERAVSVIRNRDAAQKLVDAISLVRRSQSIGVAH